MIIFHLLNDYSGSTMALCAELPAMIEREKSAGRSVIIVTSEFTGGNGPLDAFDSDPAVIIHHIRYRYARQPLLRAARYIASQIRMARIALRYAGLSDETHEFFINTLLPAGAAVAAKFSGKLITFRCHENPRKSRIYHLLADICCRVADEIICVSKYQCSLLPEKYATKMRVEPPQIAAERLRILRFLVPADRIPRHVSMLCSLRPYKGIEVMTQVATMMTDYTFELAANADETEIRDYIATHGLTIPENMTITIRPDVTDVYRRSSVVLCLTNPEIVTETYGMSVAEAIAAGIPVIVPAVGGPAEQLHAPEGGSPDQLNARGITTDVTSPLTVAAAIRTLC